MEGWFLSFIRLRRRCWLIRWLSFFIGSLSFVSCGKRITDKNQGKAKSQVSNIKNTEEILKIKLTPYNDSFYSGSFFFKERAFHSLQKIFYLNSNSQITSLDIFFHVRDNDFEFSCHYERDEEAKTNQLAFTECSDDLGNTIDHLKPGVQSYLPQDEEIYFEATGLKQEETIKFQVLRN